MRALGFSNRFFNNFTKEKNMTLTKKLGAEFIGTFWLVLGGCGSAVLAAGFPDVGIGLLGVSLAFGLTVLTMAFAIGHISGCHLNPAVSFGLWSGGRFSIAELGPYIAAQVAGGITGAAILYVIASGQAGFDVTAGFASNGYAEHSPGGYSLIAALVTEIVMTFMFLIIILGATDKRAPQGFAPIAIGLGLTLIHLISIPVTNTSVNPARSTAVAIFQGDWALSQLWLFWLAPIVGAILAGIVYRWFEMRNKPNNALQRTRQSVAVFAYAKISPFWRAPELRRYTLSNMKLKVFVFFIFFVPAIAIARLSPDKWEDFIGRTSLIIKGTIIEKRLVYDEEGWPLPRQVGKVDIVDVIVLDEKYSTFNKKSMFIHGFDYRDHLGEVGYFFIFYKKDKWFLADPDAAKWKINHPNSPRARKYREGDVKEIKFPDIYLWDIPTALIEKKYSTPHGSSLNKFSEKRLIEYFKQ
jgi:aquaporin Z